MMMVTVATFIAGRYVFRDGFANVGWHWGKPRHYLAIVGLIVLLWVFPTLVRLAVGTVELSSIDRTKTVWLLVVPLVLLIPGFGEEFGWRGYMLPHLFRRLGVRKAVVLQGVIWWAWHLPVLTGTGIRAGIAGAGAAGIPVGLSIAVSVVVVIIFGAVPTILHGIVIAYIWVRSQSLAVATAYHALYDGVRDSLTMLVDAPSMVGLWVNAVLTILGILLLWRGNWKYPEGTTADLELPNPART
jgi:membrane protease YdiL (CAAX protease family)